MSAQQSCGVDIRQRHDLDAEGRCKVWDMMMRCNHSVQREAREAHEDVQTLSYEYMRASWPRVQ